MIESISFSTTMHLQDVRGRVFRVDPLGNDPTEEDETLDIGRAFQRHTVFLRDDQIRELEAELATSRYSGQGQAFEAALAIHRGHEAGREALGRAL